MALRTEFKEQGNFLFKYRSYLPVIILLVGLYLYIQKEMHSVEAERNQRIVYEAGCFLVCLLGLFIRVITVGFTGDNTSGRNTSAGQIADSVNKSGLYSLCRHPLYLGNFFMWLGLAAFTQNLWFIVAFIFMYWVYYERIMYAEEEYLITIFGDEYINYSQTTNAFIPNFSKWIKPIYKFSFRKIIRQEKTGILNLFIVIVLFRGLGEYFKNGTIQIEKHWQYGLIFSICWYVVIKLIQKNTKILATDR